MVARVAAELRQGGADLAVAEWDVTEHPEVAKRYRLYGALGIVINGFLEVTGMPTEEELREKLESAL